MIPEAFVDFSVWPFKTKKRLPSYGEWNIKIEKERKTEQNQTHENSH